MKELLLVFISLCSLNLFAEQSDAFLVNIYDRSIKVISPDTVTSKVSVIIQNNTLSNIRGKIVSDDGKFVKHISVYSEKRVSIEIPVKEGVKNSYISLAPAFQEVELLAGKKTYEVPPKK